MAANVHDHTDTDCMTIAFAGEAYESFQRAIDGFAGWTVQLTVKGEKLDATILGADYDADDGATVRYRDWDDDKGEATGPVKSCVPERIYVY